MAVQLLLITGRNAKHVSLENVYLILFSTKISVRAYHKGWSFSSHQITGRNVNVYHWKIFKLILVCYENKCKVIP